MRYIRDNNTLGLNYYTDIKDALLSDLVRQASINTENQFIAFYDSSWKDCKTLENTLHFIKMGQLTMAHMFQDQLINQFQKVIKMQHAL